MKRYKIGLIEIGEKGIIVELSGFGIHLTLEIGLSDYLAMCVIISCNV